MWTATRLLRPDYSRNERLSDAIIHVTGVAAALVSVPVLITLAVVWRGDSAAVLGTAIYGLTLLAMILCSALYHMVPAEAWRQVLKRLDHSAIYFKIAGTYTPFAMLSGGHGAGLVAGLWGAAFAGAGLKSFDPDRFRWVGLTLYLAMGWAGLFLGWTLFSTLSPLVLGLIVAGGLLYTLGTVFFLYDAMPFHNTIWHGFVLLATIVFYCAVLLHVIDTIPLTVDI
jgi:hemolysin III